MWSSIILGLQAASTQPAPAAPVIPEVHYVRVAGTEERAMKLFASMVEGSAAAGRIRPSAIQPPPFERCAATGPARMHRIDTQCIRALVPESRPGRPPVIALAVVEDYRPNITGRVVFKGHTIYCIGARSVGFEDLSDPLGDAVPGIGVQSKVDECIADALSVEREMARDREGGRHWLYSFAPDRLAENAQAARGSSDGVATVRVGRLIPNPGGPCRVSGTIERVESGQALRAGDRLVIEMPRACTRVHPILAPLARPGSLVRLYGAWSGGIRFIEPITGADSNR